MLGPKFWKKLAKINRNRNTFAPDAIVKRDSDAGVVSGTNVLKAAPNDEC